MNKKKNILLLMVDQQRLDYTGYSGSGLVNTPNMDRIAESIGFTACQTINPICTPARTGLITGKYTHQIGTLNMSGDLSLQFPTFMKALQKEGYHTSGIGKFHFLQTWEWNRPRGMGIDLVGIRDQIKQYGYDYVWETSGKQLAVKNYCDYCAYLEQKGLLEKFRDFVEEAGINSDHAEQITDFANPWPFEEKDYVDVVTADKIIERIQERPIDKPFYIFGSFCSPHKPYDAPQRYLDMVAYEEKDDFILPEGTELSEGAKKILYCQRRSAKAMVRLIDDQIGRILNILETEGLMEDTVILFTCDHGDMLGDHERLQKSIYWKEACTVPAAIRHPDYLNQIRNDSPVSLIDFAATILDVAGIDYPKALSVQWPAFNNIVPCKSLMPIVKEESEQIRNYTFSECKNQWQMIQTQQYKYVRHLDYLDPDDVREEFYDIKADPKELHNLIHEEAYQEAVRWCRRRRDFVMDTTPPAQTFWAPLIGDEGHYYKI